MITSPNNNAWLEFEKKYDGIYYIILPNFYFPLDIKSITNTSTPDSTLCNVTLSTATIMTVHKRIANLKSGMFSSSYFYCYNPKYNKPFEIGFMELQMISRKK